MVGSSQKFAILSTRTKIMSEWMRVWQILCVPGMYGAYHHITVLGKEDQPLDHVYDVTGSLCENNDKFAIDRELPEIEIGDVFAIHETGSPRICNGI